MKNKITLFLAFLSTIVIVIPACEKEGDPVPPASKTKTQLLTQSSWKFSAATASGIDVSSSLQACQKDNIYSFIAVGTGTFDEGPAKCNAGDPQTTPFTWNWLNSEATLHISTILFTGGNSDFTLVTLSETQLIVSQLISGQTVIVTFIH